MSTPDQTLASVIHGEALTLARDQVPQELLDPTVLPRGSLYMTAVGPMPDGRFHSSRFGPEAQRVLASGAAAVSKR